MESNFDREENVVGELGDWQKNWEKFWQERGVSNFDSFKEQYRRWWKGIEEGNLSLCRSAVNFVAAQNNLLGMLVGLKKI